MTNEHKRHKTASLNLRVEPDWKDAAARAAADDRRSVTSFVEKIIGDWLAEHGYLPKGKP
jgi:uncharacterized protein (DUF1778 family)